MNPPFLGNGRAIANWRGETRYENYALFGQTTWKIFDDLTLITGLRFNREDSAYTYDDYYRVVHFPAFTSPKDDVNDVITGKVGLQYQFTDDLMAFATVSKGYKGVAYDLVTASARPKRRRSGQAETSYDYELGVRSAWFDKRLVLNATVYDTEYKNFQIQTIIPDIPNTFILANIPKARTRGVELEADAQVTDDLSLSGSYAYTDAVAVTYPLGQCFAGQQLPTTCTTTFLPPPNNTAHGQNLNGARLPQCAAQQVHRRRRLQADPLGPAVLCQAERQLCLAEHDQFRHHARSGHGAEGLWPDEPEPVVLRYGEQPLLGLVVRQQPVRPALCLEHQQCARQLVRRFASDRSLCAGNPARLQSLRGHPPSRRERIGRNPARVGNGTEERAAPAARSFASYCLLARGQVLR